jgi:anti-sigma regulatory factor (Ser/Thr protein kinase)
VGQVRRDLAEIITGFPLADDLLLVASELCANAVVHSRSGRPSGGFTVLANVRPGQFVWIEVMDQGGVWDSAQHDDDRPHGLDIVRALAGDTNWGVDGDRSFARVVWVRLRWPRD